MAVFGLVITLSLWTLLNAQEKDKIQINNLETTKTISAMSSITASGKLIFTLHENKITSIPEFNPDEKVWNHLKNNELQSHQVKSKNELKKLAKRKLFSMAKRPKLLKSLFNRCEIAPLLI